MRETLVLAMSKMAVTVALLTFLTSNVLPSTTVSAFVPVAAPAVASPSATSYGACSACRAKVSLASSASTGASQESAREREEGRQRTLKEIAGEGCIPAPLPSIAFAFIVRGGPQIYF